MKRVGWKRTVPLPATVRLAWHEAEPHPREIPLAEFYASLTWPSLRTPLPYLVAHMVMTQNGEAVVEGKAATIGTSVDGLALTRVRSAVDAVVVGSGTLIHDDVTAVLPDTEVARRNARGRPPRLLVAVVATTLDWDAAVLDKRFFSAAGFDKLVVTGTRATGEEIRAVEARGGAVVRVPSGPDGRPQIAAVLGVLAGYGATTAVCEGGPRFLQSLVAAGAIREYFLTTSPMVTGDPQVPRPIGGPVGAPGVRVLLSRISRHEHDFRDPGSAAPLTEAFERFRVVYSGGPRDAPPMGGAGRREGRFPGRT
ncbi:MAG TPA: dihydrofolate reductase family protein [bacterium]|nr:dihydrofolate reductase family protein [bacterium]